jgi:hypothetical protein
MKDWKKIGDPVKKYKLRKHAKFNYDFVELAARLKAAGFTNKDLGYVFNVNQQTVSTWQERYPEFKQACAEGKDLATKYLVAQGLRAACGYEYEDCNEKYTVVPELDKEGKPTGKMVEVLKERSVFKKHQAANPQLLIFMLANFDSENWQSVHKIQVDKNENIKIQLDGKVVSKQIDELAGRLIPQSLKKVESHEVK